MKILCELNEWPGQIMSAFIYKGIIIFSSQSKMDITQNNSH